MAEQSSSPGGIRRTSRRSLFGSGRASDTDEWIRDLEEKTAESKIKKWNFDFRTGFPLEEQGTDSPSSSLLYEAVDEKQVPEFYRTKTIRTGKTAVPSSPDKALKTPRKKLLRHQLSEQMKSPTADTSATSPRKSTRLRKAQSMETTPQKKAKKGDVGT